MSRTDQETLRSALRRATQTEHQRLDDAVGPLSVGDGADYARFLAIQYIARWPIEQWFATSIAPADRPPPQCDLIAADLAELNRALPEPQQTFVCSPAAYPGVAWVIAGSSMGNRFIRKQREKSGLDGPDRFLSCPQMPLFFKRLLCSLGKADGSADRESAIAGAKSVFSRFQQAANGASAGHEV